MSELALKLIRENIEKHERGEDASLPACWIWELWDDGGAKQRKIKSLERSRA